MWLSLNDLGEQEVRWVSPADHDQVEERRRVTQHRVEELDEGAGLDGLALVHD